MTPRSWFRWMPPSAREKMLCRPPMRRTRKFARGWPMQWPALPPPSASTETQQLLVQRAPGRERQLRLRAMGSGLSALVDFARRGRAELPHRRPDGRRDLPAVPLCRVRFVGAGL